MKNEGGHVIGIPEDCNNTVNSFFDGVRESNSSIEAAEIFSASEGIEGKGRDVLLILRSIVCLFKHCVG